MQNLCALGQQSKKQGSGNQVEGGQGLQLQGRHLPTGGPLLHYWPGPQLPAAVLPEEGQGDQGEGEVIDAWVIAWVISWVIAWVFYALGLGVLVQTFKKIQHIYLSPLRAQA